MVKEMVVIEIRSNGRRKCPRVRLLNWPSGWTDPSLVVEEGLAAVDGAEGALAQFAVDDDALARDLPLVQRQQRPRREQAQRPHTLLRVAHLRFHFVARSSDRERERERERD